MTPPSSCPCPDPACSDVHAHDVTASFQIELPPLSLLLGQFQGKVPDA